MAFLYPAGSRDVCSRSINLHFFPIVHDFLQDFCRILTVLQNIIWGQKNLRKVYTILLKIIPVPIPYMFDPFTGYNDFICDKVWRSNAVQRKVNLTDMVNHSNAPNSILQIYDNTQPTVCKAVPFHPRFTYR